MDRCSVGYQRDTAKTLVQTMRRTAQRPDLRELLAGGEISFDRVDALSRITEDVGLLLQLDVAGVLTEAAKRVRITAEDEVRSADDQFLVMQPSLDESSWRLWGGLDGYSGAIVDKALWETADKLPTLPDGSRGDTSWRKANALVQLCVSDEAPPSQVTLFVDAKQAVETNGEAGVVLEAGPRVGKQVLEAVLCDATVEATAKSEDGTPMVYGRSLRTASPALKRALLYESQMMCSADGCTSRYRLQIHHVNSWAQGGETPKDLVVLCWFHHHVGPPAGLSHLPDRTRADQIPSPQPTRSATTHLNTGVTPPARTGSSRPKPQPAARQPIHKHSRRRSTPPPQRHAHRRLPHRWISTSTEPT